MSAIRLFLGAAALAVFGVALGCGDGGNASTGAAGSGGTTNAGGTGGTGGVTGGGGGGGATGGTGGTAGAAGDVGPIPDPGTAMGADWADVEPNDKPSQATPVGILNGPIWAGFADPPTAISSNTDVDYFVFKSPDAATLPNVGMQMCWSFSGNLLDLNLYDVVDSKKAGLVKSATSTNTQCETLLDFGEAPSVLKADTEYLLEVVAGPGLDLMGDPGYYGA